MSEWPHCCSRARYYFSMDRLFFSGMILSGREIILNAGGDRRSLEYRCVLMTTATESGRKSANFRGVSNTIRSVHTAETFTMPQVRVLDKWCPKFLESERGRRDKSLLWWFLHSFSSHLFPCFFNFWLLWERKWGSCQTPCCYDALEGYAPLPECF